MPVPEVLDFMVCISVYCDLYCGMYWYVLAQYVLSYALVCIVFGVHIMAFAKTPKQ